MPTNSNLPTVNILTLKWGNRYDSTFVNRLYRGVRTYISHPFRFFCFTDDGSGLRREIEIRPLPTIRLPDRFARTTWLKLGLFMDGQVGAGGDCLFVDLDVLITGNMDCFFSHMPSKRCIIHNWVQHHLIFKKRPEVGNSSIFRWRANTMQFAVDKFYSEMDWALSSFHPPQVYLTLALGEKYWWPESWVRSFKRHCVPAFPMNLFMTPIIPRDARILVFHGLPDPDQAMAGHRAAKLHRWTRPARWIGEILDGRVTDRMRLGVLLAAESIGRSDRDRARDRRTSYGFMAGDSCHLCDATARHRTRVAPPEAGS